MHCELLQLFPTRTYFLGQAVAARREREMVDGPRFISAAHLFTVENFGEKFDDGPIVYCCYVLNFYKCSKISVIRFNATRTLDQFNSNTSFKQLNKRG